MVSYTEATNTSQNGYANGVANSHATYNGSDLDGTNGLSKDIGPATMPIAIVGMSCRFPGDASSPAKLWELISQGRSAWSTIPKDRFNQEAFYHPQDSNVATMNVQGGHFLTEDVSLFDASFFNVSAEVAASMDPQYRLQLESTFEAIESAGITLTEFAGSNTSVFAGAFFRDYHDALMRDPETLPRYFMTGNGAAMVSNRLSYFFDLRGASVTVDTGCSTGLTALHLACQSIRNGEAAMSIVAGVNVMINPDMFVSMSNLGLVGPEGRSFTFDRRGKGYGRGEGVATLILKPLDVALRNGDPVSAVIRETALNQDGRTPTITSPSPEAQQDLIRTCYRNAGLNPLETAYVEAHGTGTRTGDPIEAEAIGKVLGQGRPVDQPLLVGSIKSNIGHLEAASGLAAVIKVALAFEKGVIPPNHNYEEGNTDIMFDEWRLRVPTKLEPWPAHLPRRASVSNFGYGGTNAHVIMEDPACYLAATSTHSNGAASGASDGHMNGAAKTSPPRLVFPISARDEVAAKTRIQLLRDFLQTENGQKVQLQDLAYTLGQRRSRFPWMAATHASSITELAANLSDDTLVKPKFSNKTPRLGFVFNGQGAQWFAMGRELMGTYPVFDQCLQDAELELRSLGADWSLIEELTRDEATTRVNETQLAMPLSVSIQIALVQLLASWGITPKAVTGHSSGEIAAAFAAGALDLHGAVATAYFRGLITDRYLVQDKTTQGSMMAVGLGAEAVEPYLAQVQDGKVVVACVNSPSSVTVSGDSTAVRQLEAQLQSDGVFARALRVPAAYHSHHMARLADKYKASMQGHVDAKPLKDGVLFSSPVTGRWVEHGEELGPAHWVKNMVQPVLFNQSFYNMCVGSQTLGTSTSPTKHIDTVIEIGPHGALAGPIRQILTAHAELAKEGISYVSCLNRGTDAVHTMQTLAANLLEKGCDVNFSSVSFPRPISGVGLQVCQLPVYPWNHSTRFWMEPLKNKDYRHRTHAPHDLLGTLIPGSNKLSPTWRHVIRTSEVPWVRDHVVDNEIVYPGAGQVAMAIEAYNQLHAILGLEVPIASFELRDIQFMKALIIPDNVHGAEVHLCLGAPDDQSLTRDWREFHISTVSEEGEWSECCKGLISGRGPVPDGHTCGKQPKFVETADLDFNVAAGGYNKSIDVRDFYESLYTIDIRHGDTFQNLEMIRSGSNQSLTALHIADTAAIMPAGVQAAHVIHPITLDQLFQAAYTAVDPKTKVAMGAAIPRSIKKLSVSSAISAQAGTKFHNFAKVHYASAQGFDVSMALKAASADEADALPVLEVGQMHYQTLGNGAQTLGAVDVEASSLCHRSEWVHDMSVVTSESYQQAVQGTMSAEETSLIEDLKRATIYIIDDVLRELSEADVANLDGHYKTFLEWLRHQQERAAKNEVAPGSARWSQASAGIKQRLWEQVRAASVNGEMLVRIGENLLGILRKEVTPLELMMEEKLLYKYYENALRVDRSLEQVQKLLRTFSHAHPRAKVLEIGSGTGACTGPALRAMSSAAYAAGSSDEQPRFAQYDFTDISSGFFETARETFAPWAHLMRFAKLDVESDATEQGFALGSYDLIIACQVLHATKDMDHTMRNVRKLLKPGGKLVMVETTQDAMDVQLVFGTLPGWWLSTEPERKYSPNMSADLWAGILGRTGFSGVDVAMRDCEDDQNYAMSVIMSTAQATEPAEYPDQVTIAYDGTRSEVPSADWLCALQTAINAKIGSLPTVETLEQLQPAGKVVVFVSEAVAPVLDDMDAVTFARIQALLNTAKGVLWVTSGAAVDCPAPERALHTGLLRTRRMEDSGKRYIAVDLDPREPVPSVAHVADVIARTFNYATEKSAVDFEYAFRSGELFVPRIGPDLGENQAAAALDNTRELAPEMQPFAQPGRELRMGVEVPGMLDSLTFRDDPEAGKTLPEDFVEIEVRAFGLNFRDIMVSMGQLQEKTMGFECSGIITRVGRQSTAAHGFQVGDRVCALTTRGHWASRIRIHYTGVGHIPDSMSFVTAASIPMVFVTAYYSLFEKAQLRAGETVLIHAASGGVGQAAILLAQWVGAEVFATSSPGKRAFLTETYGIPDDHIFSSRDVSFAADVLAATGGRGVDVVLNSLAGEMLQASWDVVATLGRFVEIGKRDIQANKRLAMEPFGKAISFLAVDLIQLGNYQGPVMHRVMKQCLDLLAAGTVQPIQPITVFPIADIQRAFRTMQAGKHMGKIVIEPREGDLVKVVPRPQTVQLRPDASYLLVGGLGGIGQSIARWLVAHGAQNLIVVSRSAASQSHAAALAQELTAAGCKTAIHSCNSADAKDLARALEACSDMPPVKGVIQAAMVLNDSVFEHMEYDQWVDAIRPKVLGSRNLHTHFGDQLDFFVMLSSATGVLGNTSQANYAAGGTFQDALARHRTAHGLPAVSIDLGMVKSVGYVAETKGVTERLAKVGYRPLEEDEVMCLIGAAIQTPLRQKPTTRNETATPPADVRHSQVITGIAPFVKNNDVAWREEERFAGLRQLQTAAGRTAGGAGHGGKAEDSFGQVLSSVTSMEEAAACVAAAIVNKLAEMFMFAIEEIDTSQGLGKYGVDSLVAVELRNWLVSRMQTEVSIFDILQSASLLVLAEKAAAASKYVVKAGLEPVKAAA